MDKYLIKKLRTQDSFTWWWLWPLDLSTKKKKNLGTPWEKFLESPLNTHMVVMELVLQELDECRNNGVISKLTEFLLGEIWVYWLVGIPINYREHISSWIFYDICYTYKGLSLRNFKIIGLLVGQMKFRRGLACREQIYSNL